VQLGKKPRRVFVKMFTGKTVTCDADFNAPILFLKMILMEKEKIAVGRFSVAQWIGDQ
jgi:hypothetical protein